MYSIILSGPWYIEVNQLNNYWRLQLKLYRYGYYIRNEWFEWIVVADTHTHTQAHTNQYPIQFFTHSRSLRPTVIYKLDFFFNKNEKCCRETHFFFCIYLTKTKITMDMASSMKNVVFGFCHLKFMSSISHHFFHGVLLINIIHISQVYAR